MSSFNALGGYPCLPIVSICWTWGDASSRHATCMEASAEILARGIVADTPQVHAVEAWLRPRLVCRVGDEAHGALAVDTIVRARPRRR